MQCNERNNRLRYRWNPEKIRCVSICLNIFLEFYPALSICIPLGIIHHLSGFLYIPRDYHILLTKCIFISAVYVKYGDYFGYAFQKHMLLTMTDMCFEYQCLGRYRVIAYNDRWGTVFDYDVSNISSINHNIIGLCKKAQDLKKNYSNV